MLPISISDQVSKIGCLFLQIQRSKNEVEEKLSAADKENLKLRMEKEENLLLVTQRDRQVSAEAFHCHLFIFPLQCILVCVYCTCSGVF